MADEQKQDWFGSVVRNRRKSLGLTLQEVADSCGCTKAYLSTIETGKSGPPSKEILEKMEVRLGYATGELIRFAQATQASDSVAWMVNKALDRLRDGKPEENMKQNDPINLDRLLRQISPGEGQAEPAPSFKNDNIQPVVEPLVQIPILNDVTAGKYPNLRTDLDYPAGVADRYVQLPGVSDPNAFACTVLGESMMPRYMPGDIVVFAPNEKVLSGDDCFVRLASTETTFKRVIDLGEGMLRLLPLNPTYQPWEVNREDVTGLWRAVKRIECLRRAATTAMNKV